MDAFRFLAKFFFRRCCYSVLIWLFVRERECRLFSAEYDVRQQYHAAVAPEATPERSRSLLGAARKLAATFRGKAASSSRPSGWFGGSAGPQCPEERSQDVARSTAAYDAPMQTSSQSDCALQNGQETAGSVWQTQFSGMSCRRKRVSK